MEGGVQDYHPRLEEYCKLHPYFERSVRHFVNMFRYIPYSEVLDTLDFLLHDRFWDIMLKDLEDGITYIFLPFKEGKSGYYFTHLFVDMIKKELDIKYHNLILVDYGPVETRFKYIIVDDASYSGSQMYENISHIPGGELYIILVAASEEAIQTIVYNMKQDTRITIGDIFIGATYPNVFDIQPEELYFNWDIIYESNGVLYSLLGFIISQGKSSFYFQHKLPDDASIPGLLVGLKNPTNVDRILTLDEKKLLTNDGVYWVDIIKNEYWETWSSEGFFPLVDDVKPFYKK